MSSRPLGNAAAGWESANGTAQEGATAFPASPAPHKVLKPRRRKSVQSNPPSVMSTSSSLLSPENSGDERSPNNRGPPQRPSVSQIGQGAVVPPMPPISGEPPMGVTLVQAAPQDSPSRRRSRAPPQGELPPAQLPETSSGSSGSSGSSDSGNPPAKAKVDFGGRKVKAVGTLSEVIEASVAARTELLPFVRSELPAHGGLINSFQFGLATFNLRFVFVLFPFLKCLLKPFTREMVNLGGLERVQLLIVIARFDIDGDGDIDEAEFEISRKEGEKAIANAIAGCQNFAIISALLFGATHLANIGRPVPFKADQASVDEFGEQEMDIVMWVIYVLNVVAETLALSIMITSIFIRQLVSNALPSVISKLAFLSDTNILSNMATLVTWMLAAIVWVVTLGGFPAVPTHGFASAGAPMAIAPNALTLTPTLTATLTLTSNDANLNDPTPPTRQMHEARRPTPNMCSMPRPIDPVPNSPDARTLTRLLPHARVPCRPCCRRRP